MKDSIGPLLISMIPSSQPHWKTTTITPSAAPMLSRFMNGGLQRDHERAEDDHQQQRGEQHDDADEQRQLVAEGGGEVD